MKKILAVMVAAVLFAACGGGGGTSSDTGGTDTGGDTCDFIVSLFTNGPNVNEADSYWGCESSTQTTFALGFYDDGTGASTAAGPFTWSEVGCREIDAQLPDGLNQIRDIDGSIASGIASFRQIGPTGEEITATCILMLIEEENTDTCGAAPATNYIDTYMITSLTSCCDIPGTVGLENGSFWESYDTDYWSWSVGDEAVVCGTDMVNLDEWSSFSAGISVTWDSGTPMLCGLEVRYSIDEIRDDGQLIVLDDGSCWSVSSFDAFDTRWWSTFMDTIVITADWRLVNMDEMEFVDATRLN